MTKLEETCVEKKNNNYPKARNWESKFIKEKYIALVIAWSLLSGNTNLVFSKWVIKRWCYTIICVSEFSDSNMSNYVCKCDNSIIQVKVKMRIKTKKQQNKTSQQKR